MTTKIAEIVTDATKILIIQADNPDGDSLGSALALEAILGDMGKECFMYCGVDMPGYLRYMTGWDRVTGELPAQFDASIIVDASTMTLLEKMQESGKQGLVAGKPCIVLDHHETVENVVPFATVLLNDPTVSSTGELIYNLANELDWPLKSAGIFIMSAVLGDTQGLSNSLTSPATYRLMADLTEKGVDRHTLEEQRREYAKMPPEIFSYKAKLIERTEFHLDGKLAIVTIPQSEIVQYSPLYNPAPLIQTDMLQTSGIGVAIVLKHYDDGKVLGAIRCNAGYGLAADLAEHFGGGGHTFASGFKLQNNKDIDKVKQDCISKADELMRDLLQDNTNATIQHTYSTD